MALILGVVSIEVVAMNTRSISGRYKGQEGFLLLEVLLAIVIFSIGILGVLGLQAVMAKNSTEANFRSIASLVAEERISEMWADPANAIGKLEAAPGTNIEPILPSGRRIVVQLVPGRYQITVTWQLPGQSEPHNYVTVANITGG